MESHDDDDRAKLLDSEEAEADAMEAVEVVAKQEVVEAEVTVEKPSTSAEEAAANVIEKSASGEVAEEKDHEMQEEGSAISDIKIEMITLDQVHEQKDDNGEEMKQQKATLLEQALAYRQEHPEQWFQRQIDGVKRVQESYGIYDEDPFIESYYKRLAELEIEAEKIEEIRKTLVSMSCN